MDSRFWLFHFWLPLLLMSGVLYLLEHSSLDMALARFWYQQEGGAWALRDHWFSYGIMHHWGKRMIIGLGLSCLLLYALSWKVARLRTWRWSLLFTLVAMILVPTTVATLKRLTGVPCPWDLADFGGTLPYLHSFQYTAAMAAGHCFPAAHASSGFGLLGLYFAFSPFIEKHRYWLLLPGLITGISFGFAQQLRGAHFISHDLWTAFIAWFGLLLLLVLAWRFTPPGGRAEHPESAR